MQNHANWNSIWDKYRKYNLAKLNNIYDKLVFDVIDKNSRILDLGCGSGEFVRILNNKGYLNVQGLEPQKDLVDIANSKSITVGDCLDANYAKSNSKCYDVITMLGVLHHLRSYDEVIQALNNIRIMLKDGGGLFVSVEPRNSLFRKIATKVMFSLPTFIMPQRVKLSII